MEDTRVVKSNVRIYWYIWSLLVILFLTARFTVFKNSSDDVLFIILIYNVTIRVSITILLWYEGHRFRNYLKQHHGSKVKNSLTFLFSKDDLGDPIVREFKKEIRRVWVLTLTILFTEPVLFLTVILFSN